MPAGFGLSPSAERSDRPALVIDCADSAEVSEEPSREMLFPITIYLLWMHFLQLTSHRGLGWSPRSFARGISKPSFVLTKHFGITSAKFNCINAFCSSAAAMYCYQRDPWGGTQEREGQHRRRVEALYA